jgi:ribosome maturation factor RimP
VTSSTSPASADALRVLESVLEPVASDAGFEILRLEWSGTAKQRVLRVYIDRADASGLGAEVPSAVTLDDCTMTSRLLGTALDAVDASGEYPMVSALLSAPYSLEVSSPGLDRPLCKRSHFARFIGHRVQVRTHGEVILGSAQRTFHARIRETEVDAQSPQNDRCGFVLLEELDTGAPLRLSLADIRRANLVYEG